MMRRVKMVAAAALVSVTTLTGAHARPPLSDDAHAQKARAAIAKAISWLRTQQDKGTGGWNVPAAQPEGAPGKAPPVYPAVTALVINGMLLDTSVKPDDQSVMTGVKFLLNHQQPDGGIYDRVLPSYNTSIALSALARIDTPRTREAVAKAQEFLRNAQWSERVRAGEGAEAPQPVGKEHPFYGGMGYGSHGRPDLSNLAMMLQGMHDSGVSVDDESFKRALVFLQRLQMLDGVNDMAYAKGSKQGGFIYAQTPNGESAEGPAGQTYAGTIEETMDDGTKVSRLRCYGSMSYSGFKSYIYAGLKKDDARVKAAYAWIQHNYSVEENPGMKQTGFYYYLVTMARALHAYADGAEPTIISIKDDGTGDTRNWANDLIDKVVSLQSEDGPFKPLEKRWMETDPVLVTAYALIALEEAMGAKEEGAGK